MLKLLKCQDGNDFFDIFVPLKSRSEIGGEFDKLIDMEISKIDYLQ